MLLPLAFAAAGTLCVIWYAVTIDTPKRIVVCDENIEQRARHTSEVIRLARHEVCAHVGELDSKLWSDNRMIEAIKKAIQRGTKFRIIHTPRIDCGNSNFFEVVSRNQGSFEFRQLETSPNYITVDDKFLGWDTPHRPFDYYRSAIGKNRRNSMRLKVRFDWEWKKAKNSDISWAFLTKERCKKS